MSIGKLPAPAQKQYLEDETRRAVSETDQYRTQDEKDNALPDATLPIADGKYSDMPTLITNDAENSPAEAQRI